MIENLLNIYKKFGASIPNSESSAFIQSNIDIFIENPSNLEAVFTLIVKLIGKIFVHDRKILCLYVDEAWSIIIELLKPTFPFEMSTKLLRTCILSCHYPSCHQIDEFIVLLCNKLTDLKIQYNKM
ncbi:hypothetical protein MXB_2318 [Myxobolus squamalis]|nr:hypothetical protein MXB_2318 [Myxobolus squamalis]